MTHLAKRVNRSSRRGLYRFAGLVAVVFLASANASSAQTAQELLPVRIANFSYGSGVAIEGDIAAVTGFLERHPTYNVDVATIDVYRYNGTTWELEQHLFSDDQVFYNDLGSSVQIDGGIISVGAPHTGKGAVVTFRHDGTSWVEEDLIQPLSPTALTDNFGDVTARAGDVLVVPDTRDWDGFVDRELSYVFRHDGTNWIMDDTLRASDAYTGSGYGISAAVATDLVVLGDPFFSVTGPIGREGAAYVYDYASATWTESQKLSAGAYQHQDARFGQSVETDGTTILVGAHRDSFDGATQAGASYVFRKQTGTWQLTQRLTASDTKQQGYFGLDARVAGDRMIIGAPNDTRPGFINDGGNAYFFRFDGSQWIEKTQLSLTDPVSDDRFGWSVDMDANWVIIGAPGRRQGSWRPGAAYIFPVASLVANEGDDDDLQVAGRADVIDAVFPNPFAESVQVEFDVRVAGDVVLEAYDALGRLVGVIANDALAPGHYVRSWNTSHLGTGLYFIKLRSSANVDVASGVLLR